MICCGDLASLETLDFLNDNFSREIFYCFGNMDNDQLTNLVGHPEHSEGSRMNTASALKNGILLPPRRNQNDIKKYKHTQIFKNYGEIKIAGKSIAFVHYPDKVRKLVESEKYDFVFYGHTHKPWEETYELSASANASARRGQKKCVMLNPGNIANELYPPTFAIWNTENDKFELVRVNELK